MAIRKIRDLTPQRRNANRHTQYGMARLEDSIRADGYLTPMTAAASGEVFDGSARLETVADLMGDAEPIVVESDGTRPIVHIHTDIPTADDPRAVRLALAANRVAELNLEWDAAVLAELADEGATDGLFTAEDLAALAVEPGMVEGAGGDEFDATPEDGPTRCQPGDLWQLGRHRLLCGDSSNPDHLDTLLAGRSIDLTITSPPYNQDLQAQSSPTGMHRDNAWFRRLAGAYADAMPEDEYQQWQAASLALWFGRTRDGGACFYNHKHRYRDRRPILPIDWIRRTHWHLRQEIIWDRMGGVAANAGMFIPGDERIYWLEKDGPHVWNGVGQNRTTVWSISPQVNAGEHVCPYPIELVTVPMANVSNPGDLVFEPYCGSGTTLIAAERLGRACYGIEKLPSYADVILRRWEAETGQTAERIDAATPMHAGNPHA
jgi:DNA modification methylase